MDKYNSLMLISTQRQLILYDMCTSVTLATCKHQIKRLSTKQWLDGNNSEENSLRNDTEHPTQTVEQQHVAAIEIHYIRSSKSLEQTPLLSKSITNGSRFITLGHLIVHYKMKGISVYDINKLITTTNKDVYNDNDQQMDKNDVFEIVFNNYTLVAFGSAFLRFAFNNVFYQQFQPSSSILQQEQSFKKPKLYLQSQQISIHQLQTTLSQIQRFKNYKLSTNQINKSRQFYIFTNQNQLYQVKRIKLNQEDGKLMIIERYQLDEESAEFSLSTVTGMVVVQYGSGGGQQCNKNSLSSSSSRQIIIAMQGGNVFSYQFPITNLSSLSNPNIQYYLQPSKTLHLQQQLKSLNPTLTSLINKENIDYSVISIEMLHDGLGVIVVRKLGVWVVDFRQMMVVGKVQGGRMRRRDFADDDDEEKGKDVGNMKDKKTYQFNDARMIRLINSQISTKLTSLKKQTIISSTFILSTKNKLFNLTFSIIINKEFDTKKIYNESIQMKQINTSLIEDIKLIEFPVSNELKQTFWETKNKMVQIYGHYKQDKVFHLFI